MKKIILSLAALALLSLVLVFPGTGNRLLPARVSAKETAKKEVVQPIPTARAISYDPKLSFTFPGKVKAAQRAELSFQIPGQIERLEILEGQKVKKGEPVLLLQDVSCIEIEVQLPEQLVARGGADILDQLNVRFDANPNPAFPARTMELRMESNRETRTYALVIRLLSPANMHILPGMTATVSGIVKQPGKNISHPLPVLVPVEAVAFDPDGTPYVWIVEPQAQRAQKQQIIIGLMHDNSIEVSKGIHADDLVAIAGLHTLNETMRVRPMKKGKKGLEG
jgi:multidrug efflux pump subunit AcrA (membrane-fusion protein)